MYVKTKSNKQFILLDNVGIDLSIFRSPSNVKYYIVFLHTGRKQFLSPER